MELEAADDSFFIRGFYPQSDIYPRSFKTFFILAPWLANLICHVLRIICQVLRLIRITLHSIELVTFKV